MAALVKVAVPPPRPEARSQTSPLPALSASSRVCLSATCAKPPGFETHSFMERHENKGNHILIGGGGHLYRKIRSDIFV